MNYDLLAAIGFGLFIASCIRIYKKIKKFFWQIIVWSFVVGIILSVLIGLLLSLSPEDAGKMTWFYMAFSLNIISNFFIFKFAKDDKDKKPAKREFIIDLIILGAFLLFLIISRAYFV